MSSSRSRGAGKLVVGEPYFTAGTPLLLDRKGLGDAGPGDLVVARRTRGRARVERTLGPGDRIENVLEGLLVETGARQEFEPYAPPDDHARRPRRPPRADDVHDRPRDRRGLRRRALDRRRARLRPHRGRLVLHRRRRAARPRRRAARLLDLRARTRRADAAARARGRPLQPAAARRPPLRHRRASARRRGAELLPLRHPQRRAPVVRPGRSGSSPAQSSSTHVETLRRLDERARELRRARFARGALAHPDARDRVRVRRPRRRRRRAAAGRARCSRARRGVHDPRERGGRGAARVAQPPGALPRARTAGAAVDPAPARQARGARDPDAAGARRAVAVAGAPRSQRERRNASRRTSRSPVVAATRSPR